jgi:hypothetical protein
MLRYLRFGERYAHKPAKKAINRLLTTICLYCYLRKTQKPAIRQRTPICLISFKNTKTFVKYIAPNPAGVVQHRLIAGSCRLLRVLFISGSDFLRNIVS